MISTTGHGAERPGRSPFRPRPGAFPPHGARGFTLLELVLVMLIICTMLAMAAPSLRGFLSSRQAGEAAGQIVALTRFARSKAAVEGRSYRLNLDASQRTYWLTIEDGGSFRRLANEFGRTFSLPEGTAAVWEQPESAIAAGYIQIAADRHQTDQGPGGVKTAVVLLDGVAPLEGSRFGAAVSTGCGADQFRIHPGAIGRFFR